jgi:hypothetical protein
MHALRRLFANGSSTPALAGELEIAMTDVLREADELCSLLRKHRERRVSGSATNRDALSGTHDI